MRVDALWLRLVSLELPQLDVKGDKLLGIDRLLEGGVAAVGLAGEKCSAAQDAAIGAAMAGAAAVATDFNGARPTVVAIAARSDSTLS